jgi:L-alanine-DL-glutamate epimerase-like enolase superfamily enzyme
MYRPHPDFPTRKPVTGQQLEAICQSKVVRTEGIPGPLVIESIEMIKRDKFVFIRTRTACGLEGISICGENWKFFYPILQLKIAPYFIGTDCRDIEDTFQYMYVRDLNYKIQGLAFWCCWSWLEASILDILGKASGKFIGELFGPRVNDEVNYYMASGNRGNTPEEEIAILEERMAEYGVKALKFKVGGRMSNNADQVQGRSEGLIFAARKHFGDDMIIHADGNGSYTPDVAIRYGKMLEEINAYFYEEPCPFDYLWETKEVADGVDIPLAFGEQETSLRRFRWLIENDGCQVVQPDVQYNGGFIKTCKVARMAEAAGMLITPHVSGGIQYAHVLMLASFTPNMGKYQELKVGYKETKDFFTTDLVLKDGKINIPNGVGLGMAFDKNYFDPAVEIFRVDEAKRTKTY